MTPDQMMVRLLLPPETAVSQMERDLHGFRGRRWVRRHGRRTVLAQRLRGRHTAPEPALAQPATAEC